MIDLCIALNGPMVNALLPITMHTLYKWNNMEDVNLHFVNKDCNSEMVNWLGKLKGNVTVYQMPEPPEHASMRWRQPDPSKPEPEPTITRDVAWTCQWMLENCGHQEWAFISHFDIDCKAPLLDYYRNLIDDETGQIGSHGTGLVGYRRKAVQSSDVGFHILDDCFVVMDPEEKRWKLRNSRDRRCIDRSIPISGWDVGELLELGLLYKRWAVISETETQLQCWRTHNGSGCGRCVDANPMILERALVRLKELGLEAIR